MSRIDPLVGHWLTLVGYDFENGQWPRYLESLNEPVVGLESTRTGSRMRQSITIAKVKKIDRFVSTFVFKKILFPLYIGFLPLVTFQDFLVEIPVRPCGKKQALREIPVRTAKSLREPLNPFLTGNLI